ncbi:MULTISPECIES: hypothetical protein [unclassified Paenibacillus]|uniref:hypothetical protein n=1 Tax=unclassified Paenibacillus TaxID=185978 RepID=UPI002F429BFF
MTHNQKNNQPALSKNVKRGKMPLAQKSHTEFAEELPDAAILKPNLYGENKPQ